MWPKDNNKKVSAAVRILQQKRDASARATHLKATDGIVPSVTIERKIMSTKTSFKRIALVAASALALGGFSVISAPQASADVTSFIVANTTLGANGVALSATKYTAATVLDTRGISAFTVNPGDTVTLKFAVQGAGATVALTDSLTATMTGYGNLFTNDSITGGISGLTGTTFQSALYPLGTLGTFTATTTPGTYPIVFTLTSHTVAGVATTSLTSSVTMTVAAATVFSPQLSTSYVNAASTYAGTSDDEVRVSSTSTTDGASIVVTPNNTSGTAYIGGGTLDAQVISGPGLIAIHTTATYVDGTARAATSSIVAGASAARWISVTADGTAGVSVIRIRLLDATTGASLGTIAEEKVNFYGAVASLTATKIFSTAKASSTAIGCTAADCPQTTVASTPFVTIVAKDADGNLIPGLTVSAVISDSTILGSSTVVASTTKVGTTAGAAGCAASTNECNGLGYYNANVAGASGAASGKSATITYRTLLTGTTYITAAPVTVTIGGAIATEKLSLDKASYEAGEALNSTQTAKDASGNLPYDGQTASDVTFNKAVVGTITGNWYVDGKVVTTANTVYAPAASGAFIAKMTSAVDGKTLITVTADVVGDSSASLALDAANAATDAANNAYDEAQNATQAASDALAAVTALAAQVKSLIASVKKLTAAVAKLKK